MPVRVESARHEGISRRVCALWAASCGHAGPPQALPNGDYQLPLPSLGFEVAPAGARIVALRLPGGTIC